jgi:hypothetical protein
MKLPERDQLEIARAESGLKQLAIAQNGFAGIPGGQAEVADAFTRSKNARAASACAESMHQPGKGFKSGEFENLDVSDPAQ